MIVPKIVNAGVDTLAVGFGIAEYRTAQCFDALYEAKARAGEKMFGNKGAEVIFFDKEFSVSARGTKGYEWVLDNGDIRVYIACKAQSGRIIPEVYITFRSQYLWRVGHEKAFYEVKEWVDTWAFAIGDRVSRVDLCVDIQMEMPKLDLAKEAVTRSKGKVEYYEPCEHYISGRIDTGYKFGSGALVARIYDKTIEIKKTQKEWFKIIWLSDGWDGKTVIVRVEYQARRNLLKEMSVDNFESLCERLADLWRYFTADWLTIRVPNSDSHRYRWPLAGWWEVVQNGLSLFGQAHGILRNKQHVYKYGRLIKQGMGCTISAAALLCSNYGLDYAIKKVEQEFIQIIHSPDFRLAVFKRSSRSATMEKPRSNHLVDEIIRLGGTLESVEDIEGSDKP